MARKSNNAGITKRMESEKSLLPTSYKFELNDKIIYRGGMHPEYKGKIGTIVERSCKKHRKDYSIQFLDGHIIKYILESVLELYVESENNNSMEGCEIIEINKPNEINETNKT